MGKIVLDIDQMKYLQKIGIDTSKASMCWVCLTKQPSLSLYNKDYPKDDDKVIPAFTLQDILDLLPNKVDEDTSYPIMIYSLSNLWYIRYGYYEDLNIITLCSEELIDASYEMLCWCAENGYIRIKKDKL